MHFQWKYSFFLVYILYIYKSHSVSLTSSGGYNLRIAIEENTPRPENVAAYLNNIREVIPRFSISLASSTAFRFHINSVDVVVPESWEVDADVATSQSYDLSDIRISSTFQFPRVENPNPCGFSGQFIELPLELFNKTRITPYGDTAKALTNLFVRYRFGVWEEHGEIGNTQYPYFHYVPSTQPVWEATRCSAEIQGTILNEYHEESPECDIYSPEGPKDNCRFNPSISNVINSSLSYFPWIEAVDRFCDENSHNHHAPNRQNYFCGHKSVMEVIRASEDYFSLVGEPPLKIPVPTVNVYKVSGRPLLYLLIDAGRTTADYKTLRDVESSLKSLMEDGFLRNDIVTTIGTYPTMQPSTVRSYSYVDEVAPWATLSDARDVFLEKIANVMRKHDGPVVRNFPEAIKEVVDNLKRRNHEAGAVVLIVKRGATKNGFEDLTYFGDVYSSLHETNNIRLYAVEFEQDVKTPYTNLEPLVKLRDGKVAIVNDALDPTSIIQPILTEIKEVLASPMPKSDVLGWTVHKFFVNVGEPQQVKVLESEVESFTICLTTNRFISESSIEIIQTHGTPADPDRTRRNEWNEVEDATRRNVNIVKVIKPEKGSTWEIRVNECSADNDADCVAFLNVNAESKITGQESEDSSIVINVATSAANNYFDQERADSHPIPFEIFAQISWGEQRVVGIEDVQATIVYENRKYWTVMLVDDGAHPDVSGNDGTYSGVFFPPKDGLYKIFVSARNDLTNHIIQEEEGEQANLLGYLVAEDQLVFGCNKSSFKHCQAKKLTTSFSKVADLAGTIEVVNAITFTPRPMKIMDFKVETLPDHELLFTFTAPYVLGVSSEESVEKLHIFAAPQPRDFSKGTDGTQLIHVENKSYKPGESVTIKYNAAGASVLYFAAEGIYNSEKSGPSNVVGVVVTESGTPPMPEPTTTTTPSTTETTTTKETSTTPSSSTTPTTPDSTGPSSTTPETPSKAPSASYAALSYIVLVSILVTYFTPFLTT